ARVATLFSWMKFANRQGGGVFAFGKKARRSGIEKCVVENTRARDLADETGQRFARQSNRLDLAVAHGGYGGIDTSEINVRCIGCRLLGRAEGRRIGDAADTDALGISIFHGLDFRTRRDKKRALQEMIGIAEVDELLALLVDREEGHIPAVMRRGILNFARGLMRDDFERHAELFRERPPEGDGYSTKGIAILDGELRRG